MIALLLLQLALTRAYHEVPLEQMAASKWTHVRTCGLVTYSRTQADGDRHVIVKRGTDFVVLEIIPPLPLPFPQMRQTIEAWGIARIDRRHTTARYPRGWPEVHPVEGWVAVAACRF